MANQTGHFVWTELMSKDVAASRSFYKELFGWDIQEEKAGDMPYNVARVGEKMVAGLMQITPEMGEVPTHWMSYVTVDDVDQRSQQAEKLGGKQLTPGMDIPSVGRFAVIHDPAGAVISPFKGEQDMTPPADARPGHGEFCWYELLTTDPEGARTFYGEIFGWNTEATTEHGGDPYHMFKVGEKYVAGIQPMPGDAQHPPYWLSYVHVADVDATAEKCTQLGGKVHLEPTDIPNIGRIAVIEDNLGGHLALFKGTEKKA